MLALIEAANITTAHLPSATLPWTTQTKTSSVGKLWPNQLNTAPRTTGFAIAKLLTTFATSTVIAYVASVRGVWQQINILAACETNRALLKSLFNRGDFLSFLYSAFQACA